MAVMTRTPSLIRREDAKLLRHEIASEAAGVFHDHDANAVALDAVKQAIEAGPRLDRVRAAHGRIIEPVIGRDLEAGALGIGRDRLALALFAILVRPRRSRRSKSGDMPRLSCVRFCRFFRLFPCAPWLNPVYCLRLLRNRYRYRRESSSRFGGRRKDFPKKRQGVERTRHS